MARKRRPNATGSFYFNPGRNRWEATVDAGWKPDGSRRRIHVTYAPAPGESKTSALAEVKRRLTAKRRKLAAVASETVQACEQLFL